MATQWFSNMVNFLVISMLIVDSSMVVC
jgi:hypothetical protein